MKAKPDLFIASLYGGLFIATVWAIPGLNFLNCLCCAGVLLGGFLSVLMYQKDVTPEMNSLTREDCVRLGIYAGVISSVAGAIIQYIVILIFGNIAIDMMMQLADSMQVQFPPELYEMVEQAKHEQPSILGAFLSIFIYIIPNTLFSFLGALIGWNIFKPKVL